MPDKKQEKVQCIDRLRHNEYYGMQEKFDELYAKSSNNEIFTNLVDIILSKENILLAYRNIKNNTGSKTVGTDNLTIKDIEKLTSEEVVDKVRFIVKGSPHGYRPKPVRRKDIPKPNGSTRPLGIPGIWDRLIQQCIKQVMEPICEAKFSDNSFGFRPLRSVEHAIQRTYVLMQRSNMHYVIEFDIKSFFDNVNHSKLIKQIWALGIQDKHLIYILRQILKAPIKMPDGKMIYPNKGTPQGGIISPLLSNIVLNELDHWVDSQWQNHPIAMEHAVDRGPKGIDKIIGYRMMRRTNLKEMYIVRYADDFRIFCRTKNEAIRTMAAVTQFLSQRLKLEISTEKTRIVNVKRRYSEFLGFKIKVHTKGQKQVVQSYMCDKALKRHKQELTDQIKRIIHHTGGKTEFEEINRYNVKVMGIQNYYKIATNVNLDCALLNRRVMTVLMNRLRNEEGCRLVKDGRPLTETEKKLYGKSQMIRYIRGSDEPIYPIGYIQHKNPMARKRSINQYTAEGRKEIHDNLRINKELLLKLMKEPLYDRSIKYADNRISLFSAQRGKCAVTGIPFENIEDIHCHHITPKKFGGTDEYENLILIHKVIHILVHATQESTIEHYLKIINPNKKQISKINELRQKANRKTIERYRKVS